MKKMRKWRLAALALAVFLGTPQAGIHMCAAGVPQQEFSLRALSPVLTVSASKVSVSADGRPSPSSIQVRTDGTGGFKAVTDRPWLRIGRTTNKYSYDDLDTNSYGLTFGITNSDSGMFYVIVEENTGSASRTASIKVTHGDGVKSTTITVTQAGAGGSSDVKTDTDVPAEDSLTADQTELTADKDGKMPVSSIQVDTNKTGGFTAQSDSPWLKVNTRSSSSSASEKVTYTGSGRVYLFAQANDTTSSRSGTITLTHENGSRKLTVQVTQEASKAEMSADVTQLKADASGRLSKSYVRVNTNGTGGFKAEVTDGSWLKVSTRNSSGSASNEVSCSGNSNIYVFVQANDTLSGRSGTITLTHEKGGESIAVLVEQDAAKVELNPDVTELSADASGRLSKSYVRVNTNGTGGFTAESDSTSWLKVSTRSSKSSASGRASYTASGNVYVFAEENKTKSSRSGKIILTHAKGGGTAVIDVTQEAVKEELKVSASEIKADEKGRLSASSVQVDTSGTGGFTAESDSASWLKVSTRSSKSSASGRVSYTGSGRVYLFAEANDELSERTGTITVKHTGGSETVSIKVTQAAGKAELSVSLTEIAANAKGTLANSSVQVNTNKTGGFTVDTGDSSWIKVGKKSSKSSASQKETFTDSSRVYIFADENKGAQRTGTITVTHQKGVKEVKITITQEALEAILVVDSEKKTADKDGSFYSNAVSVKTQKTGAYTVEVKDCSWLKISSRNTKDFSDGFSKLDFDSDAKFYLTASPNEGKKRTAEVKVTHASGKLEKTVTVTQIGSEDAYLEIDRETAYFDDPKAAASGAVHVMAEDGTKWTVSTSASWIKVAESSSSGARKNASLEGEGSGTFYIWVTKNGTFKDRSGYVTVAAPGIEEHQIYVSQEKNERDLSALLEELTVTVNRKTFNKGKTSKIKLVYPEGLYASDVAKIGYASTKKKVATVNKYGTIKGIRKGKAIIKVRVVLDNGADKWFQLKVTVGKRKVSVVKQK